MCLASKQYERRFFNIARIFFFVILSFLYLPVKSEFASEPLESVQGLILWVKYSSRSSGQRLRGNFVAGA